MRVQVGRGWADLKDLKRINYGEAKRLRKIIGNGDDDAADKVILACVLNWEVIDFQTEEKLTTVDLQTLERLEPKDVLTLANLIGEGLASALPLASKSEPAPS